MEAAAFYAVRGGIPDGLISGSRLEKLFYIAAMQKEQEREVEIVKAVSLKF